MATKWLYRGDTVGDGQPRVYSDNELNIFCVDGKVKGPWPNDDDLFWVGQGISDLLLLGRGGATHAQERASQLALSQAKLILRNLKIRNTVAVEINPSGYSLGRLKNLRPTSSHPEWFCAMAVILASEVEFLVTAVSGLKQLIENPTDPAVRSRATQLRGQVESHIGKQLA